MGNQYEAASPRRLKVFLCHAVEDKPAVRNLYQQLGNCHIEPWLDEEELVGGQDWDLEIQKAVRKCDVVLICLSHEFLIKEGYGQKEIKIALDTALEKPEGANYLIPLRLENCELPERLKRLHAINYFEGDGFNKLIRALKYRSKNKSESLHEEIAPIDCQPFTRANQKQVQRSTGQPDFLESPAHLSVSKRPRMAESVSLHSNFSDSTHRIKQRKVYIVVSLLTVIILIPLVFLLYNMHKPGTPTSPTPTSGVEPLATTFGFENGVEHWIAPETDLKTSKVDATTDRVHSGSHALRLTTVLIGNGNKSYSGKEYYTHSEATVYFDQPLPGLSKPGPYNLTGKPVSCFVYLPNSLAMGNIAQAFVRMFSKDRQFANDYGPMVLIDSSHVEQWFQISLTIGKGEPDKTFDPKSVWSIGILLETTDGSTLSFNRSIYIDDCFVGHTN